MKKTFALALLMVSACAPTVHSQSTSSHTQLVENVNLNARVHDHFKMVFHNEPYKVKVCRDHVMSGDKTGDTLGGAIIGGILGKALTGSDDGAKIGALFGGIVGHDKSNAQAGTKRVCQLETRYREISKTIYSHSTITWRMNGRTYSVNFTK